MPSILTDYECKSSGDRKINLVKVTYPDMTQETGMTISMWLDKVSGRMLDDFDLVMESITLQKPFRCLTPAAMILRPNGSLIVYAESKWYGYIWTMPCTWDRAHDIPQVKQQETHPASMRHGKLITPTASQFDAKSLAPSVDETLIRSRIHIYNELVVDARRVLGFVRIPTE